MNKIKQKKTFQPSQNTHTKKATAEFPALKIQLEDELLITAAGWLLLTIK